METIWLQRSNSEVPWGFRLQGGREFAQPLSVQKVRKQCEVVCMNVMYF
jgi:hypothetical protein